MYALLLGLLLMQVNCVNSRPAKPTTIDPDSLVVMSGHIIKHSSTKFLVRDNVRACLTQDSNDRNVEIAFTYQGPSTKMVPLTSGELRRQVGLKLRAQDTCNLLYVMWHIEPDQGIFVLVKSNPGLTKNDQCGDHGYLVVKPEMVTQPIPIKVNQERTLGAMLDDNKLSVYVDGTLVWSGILPPQAFQFDGPVGVRTDNINANIEMRVNK